VLHDALADQLEAVADPRLAGRMDDILRRANRIECHTDRRPGRLAVVAVSRELSASAARRAAEAAGWEVAEVVTLDDGRAMADRLALLQAVEVDAWLLAGGFDDGASPRALEAAAMVAAARRTGGPPVVWAGSKLLTDDVAAAFEQGAVTSVANPRPDPRREDADPLREHLRELLRTAIVRDDEAHLASVALPRAVGALAAEGAMRVLAVDIGARTALRVVAAPDGTTEVRLHARGGMGGVVRVPGSAARVARIAGDAGDEAAVADLLQTLRARPATVPHTAEELAATQAAARVAVATLADELAGGAFDLVVGCGRTIAAAPHPAQAARILLDGARPVGVTQLAIDSASVLAPLGSLADDEMREGMALLADDLLTPLGTAVVSRGGAVGEPAMRVSVHRAGWPTPASIELRVGQLQVIPLPRGQEAELAIEPGPGISLGGARRSPRIEARATGGALGIVLDGRGVPIPLPRRVDDRRAVLAAWRDALAHESEGSA
jgi:hypothetical protein